MKKIIVLFVFCLSILVVDSYAQLKVNSSGYVGINKSSPSYNLDLYGTGRLASTYGSLLFDTNEYTPRLYPSSALDGKLGTSSNWFLHTYSFIVHAEVIDEDSDERIKENVREMGNSLNKIMQLRGVKYDLKTDLFSDVKNKRTKEVAESAGKNQVGFLAQELMEVFPELVNMDSTRGIYSISYTRFAPILVEAIKEQQQLIEELQNQVAGCCNNQNELKSATLSEEITELASLEQNIPNPFTKETIINCYIPQSSLSASIYIFDMQGAQQMQLSISGKENQSVKLSGNSLTPGMYLYTLVIDGKEIDTKRMILTN